jgi:methionyl-tRNA formyltransferase
MAARVVFMGSPEFAVPSLFALKDVCTVVGVITQPDRPAGRGRTLLPPPVKLAALDLGIPVSQPRRLNSETLETLQTWKPHVIVVVAFGQILRQTVLDLPEYGCVNVHASLLPRWRGAAPINAAIFHGDSESGVTIMKMDPGIDTGPILAQQSESIRPDDTAWALSARLAVLGASLLVGTLPGYLAGAIQPHPQPKEGATYAPMLKKADGRLDPKRSAEELALQVRAYQPWPGSFVAAPDGPLKVLTARAVAGSSMPGERLTREGFPALGTAHGVLVLEEVQPPGRRPMAGNAYLLGARDWVQA